MVFSKILDHVIHLTSGQSLVVPAADFRELGFNVIPGGHHADGISSNVLVILSDGVYIELLIFNSPNPPSTHWWASRKPGWIDFALLGLEEGLDKVVNGRSGSGLFKGPSTGGRATKSNDGEERHLKWRITQPDMSIARGEFPFFTEDLTPRAWRVPTEQLSNMIHSNGALGIASLLYITPQENFETFAEQLTAYIGESPKTKLADTKQVLVWKLDPPEPLVIDSEGGRKKLGAELRLRAADVSVAEEVSRGTGLYEVTLWTSKDVANQGDPLKNNSGRIKFQNTLYSED